MFEDIAIEFPEFMANKAAGKYPQGQVPVLYTPEGKIYNQCRAIMSYLGKTLSGPAGEELYPANDAEKAYFIDLRLITDNANLEVYNNFYLPISAGYAKKDEHFKKYLEDGFPTYLKEFEELLTKSGTLYLWGDQQSCADISASSFFLKVVYNPTFEHNLTLAAEVTKYPKTQAWVDNQK